MSLPIELVSQFVKSTKDEQEPIKESTVYGTIKKDQNGTMCVQLDGSEILTPIVDKDDNLQSTVVLAENDRVTVMIKNHTAIVTGNLTNPAASEEDTIRTWQLEAEKGRINELEAVNATIQGTLKSQQGVIEKLDSTYIRSDVLTTNYLTATEINNKYLTTEQASADFLTVNNELSAVKGDIRTLNSNKANIGELNAVIGRMDDLESNIITTSYLDAHYITANEIDTNYAQVNLANVKTADIGTVLANIGLITSATIVDGHVTGYLDSVQINANDITAGTLTVDRLVISGTDTSIIYALNNAGDLTSTEVDTINGDVITKRTIAADHIIAGAITANELHSESVTSDKIASKAVTAGKINVTSLESIVAKIGSFSINNSLYSNNHSAYNTANNGVYIGSDYISLGNGGKTWLKNDGSVSIGNGAINYNATNGVLDINASSIKMASQTLALKTDVDDIEIGGRNYFRPSQTVDLGCTGALDSATLTNTGSCVGFYVPTMAGDVWSISRSSIDATNRFDYGFTVDEPAFGVRIYDWNSSYRDKTKIEGIIIPEGYNYLFVYLSNQNDDASSVKIERGNKATDWTPAPEDIESSISNASKTATNYMNFSSGGLVIGDLTASSLGKNVLIDSTSVKIRTGTTENAKFGADIIELAKYNESAVISMLNDTFKIYYSTDTSEKGLGIYGKNQNGDDILAFQPVNENGNTTVGWGNYYNKSGNTNLYGNDIQFAVASCGEGLFRPYYRAGDSVEIEWYGAGFVSSSSKVVYFTIPLAKPIIGATTPNVTVSAHSSNGGLRVRQNGEYVFGAASDTHVAASSYKAQVSGEGNMVRIEATMSNTTNAVNNTSCGVDARIKLTFS